MSQDRRLSIGDVADKTGWSKRTVWKGLNGHDIETRRNWRGKFHNPDDEWLQYLDWVTPQQREDRRAVAIEGRAIAEHARQRDGLPGSVPKSLETGVARLEAITEGREE